MNFDFIEDTHNYTFDYSKDQFVPTDTYDNEHVYEALQKHHVSIDNHPLIIMANQERVDLLQHPLSLVIAERKWETYGFKSYLQQIGAFIVFLVALHLFALTSPSSAETFEDKSAIDNTTNTTETIEDKQRAESWMESLNPLFRVVLFLVIVTRAAFFFLQGEHYPLWIKVRRIQWRRLNLPFAFLLGFATYSLAFFVACQSLVWGTSSFYWQLTAITITLSWANLLLHMRLLYGIGIYLIVLKEVVLTFMIVFVILFSGFGFGIHILLSHWNEFFPTHNAVSGDDILSKNSLTQEWAPVPLPVIIFTAFVICITLLAFNILIGLTLDDVGHVMGNPAESRRISMRMELIRQMEQMAQLSWTLNLKKPLNNALTKKTPFERMVWKKIEKRQVAARNAFINGEEKRNMQLNVNELKEMNINTNKLVAEIRMSMTEIKWSLRSLEQSKLSG